MPGLLQVLAVEPGFAVPRSVLLDRLWPTLQLVRALGGSLGGRVVLDEEYVRQLQARGLLTWQTGSPGPVPGGGRVSYGLDSGGGPGAVIDVRIEYQHEDSPVFDTLTEKMIGNFRGSRNLKEPARSFCVVVGPTGVIGKLDPGTASFSQGMAFVKVELGPGSSGGGNGGSVEREHGINGDK